MLRGRFPPKLRQFGRLLAIGMTLIGIALLAASASIGSAIGNAWK
ncbi:hypothetical protein [Novosphingobium sp. P6W]|nr:hypothetical protein [Novosphingobium sp. P6W]